MSKDQANSKGIQIDKVTLAGEKLKAKKQFNTEELEKISDTLPEGVRLTRGVKRLVGGILPSQTDISPKTQQEISSLNTLNIPKKTKYKQNISFDSTQLTPEH